MNEILKATNHLLEIEERFARQIFSLQKTCELRKDDRDFQKGDILHFKIKSFQDGRWELGPCIVTHVLRGGQYGLEVGFVALSIRPYVSPLIESLNEI